MSAATDTRIPMHHRKYAAKDPKRKAIGWAVVLAVHAVVLWALITGTARKGLELVRKPLQAAVIQEVIIPPPPPPPPAPPPPPRRQIVKPAPRVPPPPRPFVPPPEVAPPVTAAPAIQSVPTPPPAPPVIAPPPPPAAPPPAPAPPSGPQAMSVACPNQVPPEMPRQAIREGAQGVVKAQATIRNGKVVEVSILSGPRVFHNAVRTAMMQYGCISSGAGDVVATQEFNFKIGE